MIANDLTQPNNLNAKFLPFEKFHLAPVTDVTAEAIKNSAFLATTQFKDSGEPELEETTAQNHIVKSLGFTGGFGEFIAKHQAELDAFKKSHGLEKKADLIRYFGHEQKELHGVSLTPRQLADRLFDKSKLLPKRVFTGHNLDWYVHVYNRWFDRNPWDKLKPNHLPEGILFDEVVALSADFKFLDEKYESLAWDSAVAALEFRIKALSNTLGDQLFDYQAENKNALNTVALLYQQPGLSDEAFARDKQRFVEAAKIFRFWILGRQEGWVEVIKFNEKLIFLKGPNGTYDFVFPGLRDEPFEHQVFKKYIHNDDVPKSNDTYHFQRWLYHTYRGALEKDRHEAEKHYYATGGHPQRIPNPDELLKRFLSFRGEYKRPTQIATLVPGYHQVELGGRKRNVSDPVSVGEFREFMVAKDFELYRSKRAESNSDCWESVNQESDASLPASVTRYDALAFATWVKKTKGLPVRLLTEDEYLELVERELGPVDLETADPRSLMSLCFREDSNSLGQILSYDPEALVWKVGPSGLKFLISRDFGEWLDEVDGALNTLTRDNLTHPGQGWRRTLPSHITGKHKGKKIGFRLCYLDGEPKPTESKKSKKSDQT